MIGVNPNIQGIIGKLGHHKAMAYKDDLLFMVSTPEVTFPNLMFLFLQYGALPNYKINYSKSEALNVSLASNHVPRLKQAFPSSGLLPVLNT